MEKSATHSPDDIAGRRAAATQVLRELFKGKNPNGWREIYQDAFDWGPDVGRERVED